MAEIPTPYQFFKQLTERAVQNDDGTAASALCIRMFAAAEEALLMQEPRPPLHKSGWPEEGRDTCQGMCSVCGENFISITPRFHNQHGFWCRSCGNRILLDFVEKEEP